MGASEFETFLSKQDDPKCFSDLQVISWEDRCRSIIALFNQNSTSYCNNIFSPKKYFTLPNSQTKKEQDLKFIEAVKDCNFEQAGIILLRQMCDFLFPYGKNQINYSSKKGKGCLRAVFGLYNIFIDYCNFSGKSEIFSENDVKNSAEELLGGLGFKQDEIEEIVGAFQSLKNSIYSHFRRKADEPFLEEAKRLAHLVVGPRPVPTKYRIGRGAFINGGRVGIEERNLNDAPIIGALGVSDRTRKKIYRRNSK